MSALLLLAVGCQDYRLTNLDSGKYPYGWEDTSPPNTFDEEDRPCFPGGGLPETTPVDDTCEAEAETGTLYAMVEWSVSAFADAPEYSQVLAVPVVGELDDDNGDGVIDDHDTPDVVIVTDDHGLDGDNTHGVIRILAGDSGVERASQRGMTVDALELQVYPYRYASVALADVDVDGIPDIVGVAELVEQGGGGGDTAPPDSGGGPADTGVIIRPPPPPDGGGATGDCALVVWNTDGSMKWVNADVRFACAGHAPAVADLEGDGAPEVILGAMVLEGATGTLVWQGDTGEGRFFAYEEVGDQSFALDLDGDGLQEVIAGRTIYDASGVERCSIDDELPDGFPAVADLDGDGLGEFVLVGDGIAHVHDTDCSLLAEWTLVGTGNGGSPTIADFDADGEPEIGIAEAETYSVYEADGTVRWSNPTEDASSHTTGSSVFDFDGDGRAEVVYADESTLWVFDGVTGQVRLRDPGHTSRTLHEYPVVADVDGDGMVEIVVPQGGGHSDLEYTGLYVLGSADRTWMGDRTVWNQHAYSITNINDDLSVPAPAVANWPEYNTFRSGNLSPTSGGALADAQVYAGTCEDPCRAGLLQVNVRVGNGGIGGMRAGVPVSVYAIVGGERRHLATKHTERTVGSGESSDVISFLLDPRTVPDGIVDIVSDDDNGVGVVTECREDNNGIRLDGLFCSE